MFGSVICDLLTIEEARPKKGGIICNHKGVLCNSMNRMSGTGRKT